VENRNDKAKAEALMESEFVDFEWSAAQDLMFMPPNSPDYQELAQAAAKIHVGEFANPFKAYSADVHAPHDLLEALSGQVDGIEVDYQSVNYIGADEAVSFFSPFDFGGAVRMGNPGVLLTSGGGMPPLANTMDNYTGISDTPGDAQFDQIVKAAFPGAGKTYDASILEFSFNVVDPAITSLRFDLIFGSEEYPDYIDTSYVDIAAVIVNDENYALFDGDPARPMSVIGNNVESGTLLDNMENQYAIEYNGISPRISIMVPLSHGGEYDVRIGVADTGDEVLDSGLFVSNMTTSATSASGMYVTQAAGDSAGSIMSAAGPATATLFEAGLGNDVMTGSVMPDIYDLTAGGENVIRGTVEQLNGDTIVGFSEEDAVEVKNVSFTNDDMLVEEGSAILRIDTTGDNQRDLTIRLEGEYDLSGFSASATDDGGTQVRYHASGQEFDSESDHGPTGSSGGGGGGAIIEEVVDAENGADEEPLDMELPREDSIALLNDVFTVVLSDIVNDHEALVREAYSVFLSLDGDFTNAEQRVGWWVSELDSEALDTDNFVAAFLDKADTHQGRYVPDAYFEVNQQLVPFVLSTTSQWAQEFAEADLQHAMLIEMIRDSVDGVANGLYEGAPLYTESGLESSNQGPSTHNIQVVGNGDEGEDWLVA
ncbi:choice-of-anchor L domain-containing protein, partial [Ectothiorhodospira haloalkaliphila]